VLMFTEDVDVVFLNKAKEKGWKIITSIHALMELLDIAKDRRFLMNSVIDNWVDVSTFLRKRREMDLNRNDFDKIGKRIDNFLKNYEFITFMHIEFDVWDMVKEIVENSNIHSSDALHLASAFQWGCHILVTHDKSFIKEGNMLLKEAEVYNKLRVCDVDKVEETLKEFLS
jgi:predicted nucleic acid-binding protein